LATAGFPAGKTLFGLAVLNQASQGCEIRIALAPAFAHHPPMLARVLSAAVNGIEAFPVEVEVNCGWGDTLIVMLSCNLPLTANQQLLSWKRL
jgi:hypothetical protein